MAMEMIERNKKYIKKRINEIIDDYLFDKGESYCRVQLWFEKSNGEHQENVLAIGKPSNKAKGEFRRVRSFYGDYEPQEQEENE